MKLKYYMRGIGIGIILTALILSIGNPKEKLTDQEIISRATALGMVEESDSNSNLENVLNGIKPSSEPTVFPTQELTPEPTQKVTPGPTQKVTPGPTQEPTHIPIVTMLPDTGKETSEINFTIKSGMSSGKVAKLLKEVGLIEDADEFNQYMESKGKASIIKVGTYSLPKGVTYEEIISKITAK